MSTLADLRADLKTESGRADLSPAELDNLINEGIRMLDRLSNFSHAPAIQYVFLEADANIINFSTDCRSLRGVYCIQAASGKTRLDRKSYDELVDTLIGATPGVPLYYSPQILRQYPDASVDPYAGAVYDDYREFMTTASNNVDFRSVLVSPYASEKFLMEMHGTFYSPRLTTNIVAPMLRNWWSTNHPVAVVNAAMYLIMKQYRNTEGMKTYAVPMEETLRSIDLDDAEEDAAEITRLEG